MWLFHFISFHSFILTSPMMVYFNPTSTAHRTTKTIRNFTNVNSFGGDGDRHTTQQQERPISMSIPTTCNISAGPNADKRHVINMAKKVLTEKVLFFTFGLALTSYPCHSWMTWRYRVKSFHCFLTVKGLNYKIWSILLLSDGAISSWIPELGILANHKHKMSTFHTGTGEKIEWIPCPVRLSGHWRKFPTTDEQNNRHVFVTVFQGNFS